MDIKMVDLLGQYNKIKREVDTAIIDVINQTAFINGKAVKDFSANLTEYMGVQHTITCANGTDALQIALMALDLEEGDEIITSPFTFIATAEVISLLKLKPVFVDIDERTFTINVEQIEQKITPKTKAIIPVHLYGQCADMQDIIRIARKHNLYIIEDTAQALGAEYKFDNGTIKKAGTIGTIGCTSFFPSKNLGAFGDGGAIFTNDDQLAEKIRMIVNHGSKIKYYHEIVGVNSRLDTLQAAILNIKLKHLDQYNRNRQKAAEYYDTHLDNIAQIRIPEKNENSTHIYHQYTIIVEEKRDELKDYLKTKGIPSMIYYPVPLHLQKAYEYLGYKQGDFPVSEALSKKVLSLPMHTELTESQLYYITETIKKFFKNE